MTVTGFDWEVDDGMAPADLEEMKKLHAEMMDTRQEVALKVAELQELIAKHEEQKKEEVQQQVQTESEEEPWQEPRDSESVSSRCHQHPPCLSRR